MAQFINIQSIINDVSELNDLLQVISQCNGNIPSILYKLAQEKVQTISRNISSLSDKPATIAVKAQETIETEEINLQTEISGPKQDFSELTAEPVKQEQTSESKTQKVTIQDIQPVSVEQTIEKPAQTASTESAIVIKEEISEIKQEEPANLAVSVSSSTPATDCCTGGQTGTRLLDDILKQRIASKDIRKAISLNDRFRFKRDLFGGSDETMCKTIEILNQMHSAEDALNYLEKNFQWNYEDETTNDFITILEKRFSL